MDNQVPWFWRVIFLSILIFFGVAGVGMAKTIIEDGDGSEWVAAEIVTTDPDDAGLGNNRDLATLYFTNNTTDFFWRSDTHTNTDYANLALVVCMDSDGNAITGAQVGEPYCADTHQGVDIIILVDPSTILEGDDFMLFTCDDSGGCTPNFDPNGAYAYATTVTEVRMSLADAGVSEPCTAGVPCDMRTSVVFLESSSSVRLDSTTPVGVIPGPTALELYEFNAISAAPEGFWWVVVVFTSLAMVGGWLTWWRYGQPQTGN